MEQCDSLCSKIIALYYFLWADNTWGNESSNYLLTHPYLMAPASSLLKGRPCQEFLMTACRVGTYYSDANGMNSLAFTFGDRFNLSSLDFIHNLIRKSF